MAKKIIFNLGLEEEQTTLLSSSLNQNKDIDSKFELLKLDESHVISEWQYFAILSFLDTEDFDGTAETISRRLSLSTSKVDVAINRLHKLNLVTIDKNGLIHGTGRQFATTTDIPSMALRKHHSSNLELAKQSLMNDEVDERDFSFITMAIDPDDLSEVKEDIKKFRRNLCQKYESRKRKEVYKLCIQLFAQSKRLQ